MNVNFKSSNKYLQIFQQLKVPTDIYKSSNNKTVPTEIYKSSNKYLQIFQQLKVPTDIYKSSNKYLQIFQQISTNLPTINDTNKNLPVPPYTDPEPSSTNYNYALLYCWEICRFLLVLFIVGRFVDICWEI